MKPIPLDQWLKREHALLTRFEGWYRERNRCDRKNWPEKLTERDWEEQFTIWVNNVEAKP